MSVSWLLLGVAAAGTLAFGASACVFLLLRAGRRALDALTPAAQARVLLCAALLPGLAMLALMTAAMAPWLGWIADHCASGEIHAHPHLCGPHPETTLPGLSLLAVAAAFTLRLGIGFARVLRAAHLAAAAQRSLAAASTPDAAGTLRVLPFPEPQAFVVGFREPTVYVTRGLLGNEYRVHLAAVLAHERAHVRRADPLRKLVGRFGLVFHLPGVAASLDRELGRALEMAADADAADALGSRERVAHALVQLQRARARLPRLAFAFGPGDVESRVLRLLRPSPGWDVPRPAALLAALGALLVAVALSAESVHHGIEMLLGLIGG